MYRFDPNFLQIWFNLGCTVACREVPMYGIPFANKIFFLLLRNIKREKGHIK